MVKAMIISLGGSPDPLKKSISQYRPEHLIFLASHDSVQKEGEIIQALDYRPKIETEITENQNILYDCYKAAKRCIDRIAKHNICEEDVVIDYTGGTKVMSAALLLAAAGMKCKFNYVGGDVRTKDGLGVVVNGHEMMYEGANPWSAFAEEEKRQVITLFNARRYSAVIQVLDMCRSRTVPIDIEKFFTFIGYLSSALLYWDQFQHGTALRNLKQAISSFDEYVRYRKDAGYDESFRTKLILLQEILENLIKETDDLKKMHILLVKDIINNARRRIEDRRFDDAAARLYRALEMYGQLYFEKEFGIPNDKVRPEIIPEKIRNEFMRKYHDNKTGFMKLPLHATFIALNEKGSSVGKRYFDFESKIRDIQSNRNRSILAHGIQPVSEHGIKNILSTICDFMSLDPAQDFFDFPKLA